jgi:hypothetical protein
MDRASDTNRSMNSSAISSWRMSRLPAMHAWPWLWKMANADPLTAAARSASGNTT